MPNLTTVTATNLPFRKKRPDQILSILAQLFRLVQTLTAAQELAACLAANSSHFECMNQILPDLAFSDVHYHFISFLSSIIQSLPHESRSAPLPSCLTRDRSPLVAFLYSLADSNDNGALDSIFRHYPQLY
jgi:hypothetical protein